MADKNLEKVDQEASLSLSDDQIITERKFARRSFVTAAGAFLIGTRTLVAGSPAEAQEKASDPDQKKASKGSDPDQKKKTSKASDPDQKKKTSKASDPDQK